MRPSTQGVIRPRGTSVFLRLLGSPAKPTARYLTFLTRRQRYDHRDFEKDKIMTRYICDLPEDAGRRSFFARTAVAAAGAAAAAVLPARPAKATPEADKSKFLEEATRLAIESVEKGWGGPFGAVIVKDGEIIGRGQNRVLLTGCPVFHAEVTAIIDASNRLNPKALLGSDYGAGTMLEMIPREADSPELGARARANVEGVRNLHQRRPMSNVYERHLLVAHRPRLFCGEPEGYE